MVAIKYHSQMRLYIQDCSKRPQVVGGNLFCTYAIKSQEYVHTRVPNQRFLRHNYIDLRKNTSCREKRYWDFWSSLKVSVKRKEKMGISLITAWKVSWSYIFNPDSLPRTRHRRCEGKTALDCWSGRPRRSYFARFHRGQQLQQQVITINTLSPQHKYSPDAG